MGISLSDLNPFSGALGKVADVVSEFVEDKDKANELAIKMQEIVNQSVNSAREHDKASYGNPMVDAIRGLIRPAITAAFSSMYVIAKLVPALGITFSEYDYAILGLVLAFWFADRFRNPIK